jgi:hypothetical protein
MSGFQLQAAKRCRDRRLHLLHSVWKARQVFTWIDRLTRRTTQGEFQTDQLAQTKRPQDGRQIFNARFDLPARSRLPSLFERFAETVQLLLIVN